MGKPRQPTSPLVPLGAFGPIAAGGTPRVTQGPLDARRDKFPHPDIGVESRGQQS
jgi:hypothetical protein